jgi:mannose-6-phosphate isomerase
LPLKGEKAIANNGNSFIVYMCIEGSFELELDAIKYKYSKGDTILIPAAIGEYKLIGDASILEIYIS